MASSNKSYDEILNKLLTRANKIIPDFTNYKDDDPLVILLKLVASMSVSSNTYSNRYLNSKFIQQVADYKLIYLLLETFDMVPKGVIPGTINVMFEYTGDQVLAPAIMSPGTEFLVGEVPFTIIEEAYLQSYNSYTQITIVEGTYKSESFYYSSIKDNRLTLDSDNVACDYIRLIIDDEEYTMIDHAEYSSEAKVFSIEYDIFQNYNIVLSDVGISEITDSSTIVVNYIESTGTNKFDPISDDIIINSEVMYNEEDLSESIKKVSVLGYTLGDTTHTLENNYKDLQSRLSNFDQAITTEDYSVLVDNYPGIAVCAAYDINDEEHDSIELNINVPFLTKIVVAPLEGYYATDTLKDNIYQYIKQKGLSDQELAVELLDPKYVTINISIGVRASTINRSEQLDIDSTLRGVINEYFKVGNVQFKSYISKDYLSSILIKSDDRIEYLDILEFSDIDENIYYLGYQLKSTELPLLGTLDITFDYMNISVIDMIGFKDAISYRDITYYLQGSRGENIKMYDLGELRHEVTDELTAVDQITVNGIIIEVLDEIELDDNAVIIQEISDNVQFIDGTQLSQVLHDTINVDENAYLTDYEEFIIDNDINLGAQVTYQLDDNTSGITDSYVNVREVNDSIDTESDQRFEYYDEFSINSVINISISSDT